MQERARHRFYFILFALGCFALAVGVGLYALKDNISLFLTPSQVVEREMTAGRVFKLGGLVKDGSLQPRGEDLAIAFVVTDGVQDRVVKYSGIVPDLFREGQGVVATGALDDSGVFVATQLLAKHDEKYMPPALKKGLQDAHDKGAQKMRQEDSE